MRAIARLLLEGSCSPWATRTKGIGYIMGRAGTAGLSVHSQGHTFINGNRPDSSTVVGLLLQPVGFLTAGMLFCLKAPAAPRYFYVDLRITQKAFKEDHVEITT